MINKDIRLVDTHFEVRSTDKDPERDVIVGYALKFNRASEDLGFIEYIDQKALDNAKMDNVVALLNHDSNYVLGRTGSNLKLTVDEIGLRFEIEPTNTTYTNDLIENMRAGLINKCSFAFTITDDGDEWKELEDGQYERVITAIDRLYDVSVVTTPAYDDTEAVLSKRSKDKLSEVQGVSREREVEVLEMELNMI